LDHKRNTRFDKTEAKDIFTITQEITKIVNDKSLDLLKICEILWHFSKEIRGKKLNYIKNNFGMIIGKLKFGHNFVKENAKEDVILGLFNILQHVIEGYKKRPLLEKKINELKEILNLSEDLDIDMQSSQIALTNELWQVYQQKCNEKFAQEFDDILRKFLKARLLQDFFPIFSTNETNDVMLILFELMIIRISLTIEFVKKDKIPSKKEIIENICIFERSFYGMSNSKWIEECRALDLHKDEIMPNYLELIL